VSEGEIYTDHGDGVNCPAGEIPLGVDDLGAVQGCYEPAFTDVTGTATDTQIPLDYFSFLIFITIGVFVIAIWREVRKIFPGE